MATVFWYDNGVLSVKSVERTLAKLKRPIQNREPGKLSMEVDLLHDNMLVTTPLPQPRTRFTIMISQSRPCTQQLFTLLIL